MRSFRIRGGLWSGLPILLLAACAPRPVGVRPDRINVVLITVDTLRADRLGCYGYARAKTPHMDQIAAEGALFLHAYAQVPLTVPSHASLFTGTYPFYHQVSDNAGFRLRAEDFTLAEALRARGYRTAAFVGSRVVDSSTGLSQGFDRYEDDFIPTQEAGDTLLQSREKLERGAGAVVRPAAGWILQQGTQPFFAWIHLFDPHDPYRPPEPYASQFPGNPYDGEIAWVDAALGTLLADLKKVGLDARTLLILTSDHGEALGEHDEATHGYFLYEPTLRVPLICRGPSIPRGLVVKSPVRSLDVMPTILKLLGIDVPEQVQGTSLVPYLRGDAAPALEIYAENLSLRLRFGWSPQRVLRSGRHKYIDSPRPELYDLEADPGEMNNLWDLQRAHAQALKSKIKELRVRYGRKDAAASEVSSPPANQRLEDLRALSYVGSPLVHAPDLGEESLADPKDTLGLHRSLLQASELFDKGQGDAAIRLLRALLVQAPRWPAAAQFLGSVHLHRREYGEAVKVYAKAVEWEPHLPLAWFNLGLAYVKSGSLTEAERAFQKALDLQPGYAEAAYNLGSVFLLAGKDAEAARAFGRAEQLNPSSWETHLSLAKARGRLNDFDRARNHLDHALALAPRSAEAHRTAGDLFAAWGSVSEAEREYREAISLDGSAWEAYNALGLLLKQERRQDEALRIFQEVIGRAPAYAPAYVNLANLLVESRRYQEAQRLYQQALGLDPQAETHTNLGNLYALERSFDRAIEEYRRALRLNPRYGLAHYYLGIAYWQTGSVAQAQKELALARKYSPNLPPFPAP